MRLVPLSTDGRVTAVASTAPAGPLRVVLEPDVAGVTVVALGPGAPRSVGRLSTADAAAYAPVLGHLGTRGLRGTCSARVTDRGALVLDLAPATDCVFANSPDGLVLLPAERTVTVTREEHHQDVLAGRGGRVAVGLRRCPITAGKYAGQPGVEVTLDGRRVGELTRLMSERYLPMIDQVGARGGRAGCEAVLRQGGRGTQVELRLPAADSTVAVGTALLPPPAPARPVPAEPPTTVTRPVPRRPVGSAARVPASTAHLGGPAAPTWGPPGPTVVVPPPMPTTVAPVPSGSSSVSSAHADGSRGRGRRRVVWAGVAVVGVLVFAGSLGNGTTTAPPPATSAAGATSTPSTSAATSTPPTTSPTPTAAPVVEPALAPAVAPTRRTNTRIASPPAAPRTTTTAKAAPPKPSTSKATTTKPSPPEPDCHPSYTPCLPIRKDMNCSEIGHRVQVIGRDSYGLDKGGEPGVGCESF